MKPIGVLVPDVSGLGSVVMMPVSDVTPSDKNPRNIPARAVEMVAASLSRFGWQQPLVVDSSNVLIAGHTRWLAAKSLKLKHVPVVVAAGLSEDEVTAYRIADNRSHDFTSWDFPELVDILDSLPTDFADVLGLADWQGIVSDYEDLIGGMGLDLPDDVLTDMAAGGFEATVVFASEPAALAVEGQIMGLPGVLDVRHKRSVVSA